MARTGLGVAFLLSCQNSRLSDPQMAVLSFAPEMVAQTKSECQEMTVSTRLPSGETVPLGTTTTINLATSSSSGAFFSDAACTNKITSIEIEAYVSRSRMFYYRDDSPGPFQLTATPPNSKRGWTAATLSATIQ
jgi:hypothetical protein